MMMCTHVYDEVWRNEALPSPSAHFEMLTPAGKGCSCCSSGRRLRQVRHLGAQLAHLAPNNHLTKCPRADSPAERIKVTMAANPKNRGGVCFHTLLLHLPPQRWGPVDTAAPSHRARPRFHLMSRSSAGKGWKTWWNLNIYYCLFVLVYFLKDEMRLFVQFSPSFRLTSPLCQTK